MSIDARSIIPVVAVAFALTACAGEKPMISTDYAEVSDAAVAVGLEKLSAARIFFGHQSVGGNLIDGFADLAAAGSSVPAVAESRSVADITAPGLYHTYVGENCDPFSKLQDFEAVLNSGVGDQVDAAFMKFCYVDVTVQTDVDAVFNAYQETVGRLKARFPDLVLIHVTAPLTRNEYGKKAAIKRFLGMKNANEADNAVREAYNAKLRAAYGGKEPLFDLAAVEAAAADGSAPAAFGLRPEYTDDGGHLNEIGRLRAARRFAADMAAILPATER